MRKAPSAAVGAVRPVPEPGRCTRTIHPSSGRPAASITVPDSARAAGSVTRRITPHRPSPSAAAPRVSSAGTLRTAASDSSATVGRIISARINTPANRLAPGGAQRATIGTSTTSPQNP